MLGGISTTVKLGDEIGKEINIITEEIAKTIVENNWCICPKCNKVNKPKIIIMEIPKQKTKLGDLPKGTELFYLKICNQCLKPL